jgi:hypothetical protein
MPKLPWTSRSFAFDFPVETWPDVVERFRGTPARIEDKVRNLFPQTLTSSTSKPSSAAVSTTTSPANPYSPPPT